MYKLYDKNLISSKTNTKKETMPISETLDKMIDSFHDYGYKEYVNDDKKKMKS